MELLNTLELLNYFRPQDGRVPKMGSEMLKENEKNCKLSSESVEWEENRPRFCLSL